MADDEAHGGSGSVFAVVLHAARIALGAGLAGALTDRGQVALLYPASLGASALPLLVLLRLWRRGGMAAAVPVVWALVVVAGVGAVRAFGGGAAPGSEATSGASVATDDRPNILLVTSPYPSMHQTNLEASRIPIIKRVVMPTLLELAPASNTAPMAGTSLLALAGGQPVWPSTRGVRGAALPLRPGARAGGGYGEETRQEAYDVAADPGEQWNLGFSEVLAMMQRLRQVNAGAEAHVTEEMEKRVKRSAR